MWVLITVPARCRATSHPGQYQRGTVLARCGARGGGASEVMYQGGAQE